MFNKHVSRKGKRGGVIDKSKAVEPTPIAGITYYMHRGDGIVTGLGGRASVDLVNLPVPLLDNDHAALEGERPSYDAVGRGIYHVLRANPSCMFAERYAFILRDAYPHFWSEMAGNMLMLEKKDVDPAYIDRKINYLKIFALVEPENSRFPQEIGEAYLDKALNLSALNFVTVNLYSAEKFFRMALSLSPDDVKVRHQLGEACYLLGKYDNAVSCWRGILSQLDEDRGGRLKQRLARIEEGVVPKVPAVDYLQAVAAAFAMHEEGAFEEAAAILADVMDDQVFREEFPLPQISYTLGLCCDALGMPRDAEEYFRDALHADSGYAEPMTALKKLSV